MTERPATRRRWFRFSLRTFLLAFTVVAVWLGWNVHLVQQRKAFLTSLPAPCIVRVYQKVPTRSGIQRTDLEERVTKLSMLADAQLVFRDRAPKTIPRKPNLPTVSYSTYLSTASVKLSWIRRQLGDEPYRSILYFPGPPAERASELFPEAIVIVADKPWPWPFVNVTKQGDGWREYHDDY